MVSNFRLSTLLLSVCALLPAADFELKSAKVVIAYGDMRFTDPAETTASNPYARQALVRQIAHEKPGALLLGGDIPWHGAAVADYQRYALETKPWRDAHIHVYPTLGNHELNGPDPVACLNNWFTAFPELKPHRWYSIQIGPAIYALNLDSNSDLTPGSEQLKWIGAQLAALPATTKYVFFNLHHPPVVDPQAGTDESHNGRPNEAALATFLAQSPAKQKVRFIVVAGHIHNYERMEKDGIVYLVSGGGGAKPKAITRGPSDLYQDTGFPNFHYIRFVLEKQQIEATMVRLIDPAAAKPGWEEKDHFIIAAVAP